MNTPASLTFEQLADTGEITARLSSSGLPAPAAADKADLLADCAQALLEADVDDAAGLRAFFVPGRIEVLGKHTDYAGGSSIIAAADRGFCVVAAARRDVTARVFDAVYDEEAEFDIHADLAPTVGHWSNYPMTVARRVARNFPSALTGLDVALASDLPPAAGMSSSSAMMVAIFHAICAINRLDERAQFQANIPDKEALAEYLACIENGQSFGSLTGDKGVGTFGGSEDHTAMLCCQAGAASQYAYCPVRFERAIPIPRWHVFAVAASGVVAEKTGEAMAKYNRASQLASGAVEVWRNVTRRDDPHLAAVLASGEGAADRMRAILANTAGPELRDRFEHFHAEHAEIIPAAGMALAEGSLVEFGQHVDRSQELADTLLHNQVPETIFLARTARELGADAASGFGAGFGGSVWALVETDHAEDFLAEWAARYFHEHPDTAEGAAFFLTGAGPAAFEVR